MKIIDHIIKENSNTYSVPILKSESKKLKKLTLKALDSNLDLEETLNDKFFTEVKLDKLSKSIANEYQNSFKEILFPMINELIPKEYLNLNKNMIRASLQPKHVWPKEDENYSRKVLVDDTNFMHEKEGRYNFCFPTRPHQDLSNNGFRSSHVLIFYFQLSQVSNETSDLEVASFENQKGLYKYENKWGYGNQFLDHIDQSLNWHKPKNLNSDHIFIMDSSTPHKSTIKSSKPRIAINVKLQPSKLNYLLGEDGNKKIKKYSKSTSQTKLRYLRDIINEQSAINTQSLFELSIINFLLDEKKNSYENIEHLCLFNPLQEDIEKIICGAFVKKNLECITPADIQLVFEKKKWVELSCVDTIFKTFN